MARLPRRQCVALALLAQKPPGWRLESRPAAAFNIVICHTPATSVEGLSCSREQPQSRACYRSGVVTVADESLDNQACLRGYNLHTDERAFPTSAPCSLKWRDVFDLPHHPVRRLQACSAGRGRRRIHLPPICPRRTA